MSQGLSRKRSDKTRSSMIGGRGPGRLTELTDPALRVGLAPYNTTDDVDRLLDGLASCLKSTGS